MLRIFEAALMASLAGLSQQSVIPRTTDNNNLTPLKFNSNGTFHISMFSDLHFGQSESSIGPQQDNKTVKVMSDVLDADFPDFVVINGDLISGDETWPDNATHYFDKLIAPVIERNLTWASTYGNHDHNYYLNATELYEREQTFDGCRTTSMINSTDAGITNYYLPVYAHNCSTTASCTPELLLWFFDSRGGYYFQGEAQPNWVDKSVVKWFNETNAELIDKYDKEIPSLAFVHIPVNASWAIQMDDGLHPHHQPGVNTNETYPQQGGGWCPDNNPNETCTYGSQDVPFMEALVSTSKLIGLFSGHDHGNTWCYKWDSQLDGMNITGNGVNLCFNQHGGYGGYGDWIRGARQIVVDQSQLADLVVDTRIRLESGDVVGDVSLNSTYNDDYYPATPDTMTYLDESSTSSSAASGSLREPLGGFSSFALCLAILALILSTS